MGSRTIAVEFESFRINDYMNYMEQFCNVLLFTVIRDPIGRAWSDLNYGGQWSCEPQGSMQCAQDNQFYLSNFYVRMFGGWDQEDIMLRIKIADS